MSDLGFTFNWHDEPDYPSGPSFLRWVGVHIGGPLNMSPEKFEELSAATDRFKAMTLTVQVNGIEVDAARFFAELEKAVDVEIKAGIREWVAENGELTEIHDLATTLTNAFREHVFGAAHRAGVVFPDEED